MAVTKFPSFEALRQFIKEKEESEFIQLWTRNSCTIESARKKGIRRHMKDSLKYYSITYKCIHGGPDRVSKSTGKRPNISTFRQGCPFTLRLKVSPDGFHLEVDTFVDTHNHATRIPQPAKRKCKPEMEDEEHLESEEEGTTEYITETFDDEEGSPAQSEEADDDDGHPLLEQDEVSSTPASRRRSLRTAASHRCVYSEVCSQYLSMESQRMAVLEEIAASTADVALSLREMRQESAASQADIASTVRDMRDMLREYLSEM